MSPDSIGPMAPTIGGKPRDFVNEAVRGSAARTGRRNTPENPSVCRLLGKIEVKVIAGRCDLEGGRVRSSGSVAAYPAPSARVTGLGRVTHTPSLNRPTIPCNSPDSTDN